MFTTDSRTENFLTSIGVDFQYIDDLLFENLIETWSTTNLGRSQTQIDDAIVEYANQYSQHNSMAPAPIVWVDAETEKIHVLDGVQRLGAFELWGGGRRFPAYAVLTDSQLTLKKIKIVANIRLQGGYQESKEWTLRHAIKELVFGEGLSLDELAAVGGWSVKQIREKHLIMKFVQLIQQVGGPVMQENKIKIIASHCRESDFEKAPVPIGKFFTELAKLGLTAENAEPFIIDFFNVNRSKKDLHEEFQKNLDKFLADSYVKDRIKEPRSRTSYKLSGESRLLRALRGANSIANLILSDGDKVVNMTGIYHEMNVLKKTCLQIEAQNKKARKAG